MNLNCRESANIGESMCSSPLENVADKFILTSLAVSSVSPANSRYGQIVGRTGFYRIHIFLALK